MEAAARLGLAEIFKETALLKRRDERALQEDEFDRDLNKQKEFSDEKKREAENAMLAATDQQLMAFQDRLDHYDTAITHALMDNERALDEVRKRREVLEISAQRLADGRLAFKANDGLRVFDQNGMELSRETIDPDSIPDSKTKWETYSGVGAKERDLLHEKAKLHEFQSKVDRARENSGKDGITKHDLDAIGAVLEIEMPDTVKDKLAGKGRSVDDVKLSAANAGATYVQEKVTAARKTNFSELSNSKK